MEMILDWTLQMFLGAKQKYSRAGREKILQNEGKHMLRKIVEKLFWHYQEKENWRMKMNEPIAIKKLTREEAEKILRERRRNRRCGG